MPSKLGPNEQNLHVPILKVLRADLAVEAEAAGLTIRDAVRQAIEGWVGAQRYRRERAEE